MDLCWTGLLGQAPETMTTHEKQPIPLALGRKPSQTPVFEPAGEAPSSGPLLDSFGRVADDLRVSVTDRCNFRCTYCMPADGLEWLPKEQILRFEEIEALVRVFVGLGVRSLKITGGEPTVRADLPNLIAKLRAIDPGLEISMTTNGYLLDRLAKPLAEAGLDRVTVSCDSLQRHRFAEMTRRDAFDQVMAGMEAAHEAGLSPIKINCVVIAGTNEDEPVEFASFARRTGHVVRFIEYMPLDAEQSWERAKVVPSGQIIDAIDAIYPLVREGDHGEPASGFRFADGSPGGIGVISSVTEPFCDTCNRLRLTAEGQFRVCLFALDATDLRGPLRAGAGAEELEGSIRAAVWRKWSGHRINHPDFVRPDKSMSMIGG
jgi:cyclic pyranopterin phosphate synthase